jgi:inosine-uridine nucleoside N-ribohydrolase
MLLAFSAKAEELDILALSLTFGNVDVQKYAISSSPSIQRFVLRPSSHVHITPYQPRKRPVKKEETNDFVQLFEECRDPVSPH